MAIIFESISLNGLRKTHLEQLLDYVNAREREGWYFGNRTQYEKRHDELKEWLISAIEYANREGVRLPKKVKTEGR